MDAHPKDSTQRIDNDMPLASLDQLASINAALAACFGGLGTLTVDEDHTRSGLSPDLYAVSLAERCGDILPQVVATPLGEVIVDGLPLGVVFGQKAPLAAGAQQVQAGVDDQA